MEKKETRICTLPRRESNVREYSELLKKYVPETKNRNLLKKILFSLNLNTSLIHAIFTSLQLANVVKKCLLNVEIYFFQQKIKY